MNMERPVEDLESTTLQDMRNQYLRDIDDLYQAEITDQEYWQAYHYVNKKLQDVEQELRARKML